MSAKGHALSAAWATTHAPVSMATNLNQMESPVRISTSVYWVPATVVEESGVSTQRAHSVARERSAVGLAMN